MLGTGALWLASFASLFVVFTSSVKEYNALEEIEQIIQFEQPASQQLHFELGDEMIDNSLIRMGDLHLLGNKIYDPNVSVQIKESPSDKFEIIQTTTSRGANPLEARRFAKAVDFPIEVSENTLTVNPYFVINRGNKWRTQQIKLEIFVPKDGKMSFGTDMHRISLRIPNAFEGSRSDLNEHTYTFQETVFSCLDCEEAI